MNHSIIILFTLLSINVYSLTGQSFDLVKVIPGIGLVYNNDSILLNRTNINKACEILKMTDDSKSDMLFLSIWDGYKGDTFEDTSGTEWVRKIHHKSLEFEFASDSDKDNLRLRWIRIGEDQSLKVYTDNGLEMGDLNPNIFELYPKLSKDYYVSDDSTTYNLYDYGVSLRLEKLKTGDLKVIEISTHYKNQKQ
jgi:hypothetical protein